MLSEVKIKEQIRKQITPKIEEKLKKHGINNIESFIDNNIVFYKKLERLAKECGVTPVQYIKVLESDYRELYVWKNQSWYFDIIKSINHNSIKYKK